METTTIVLKRETHATLRELEEYPNETFDSIVNRLIRNFKEAA